MPLKNTLKKFNFDAGSPALPIASKRSLGELVAEIYSTIWTYNNTRIHSALRMSPVEYVKMQAEKIQKVT